MLTRFSALLLLFGITLGIPSFVGCAKSDGPAENVGESVDEAAEEVGDEIDDATTD